MKKLLAVVLAALMALGMISLASAEKAPEEYTGELTIYSPHDQDPLNAGVTGFEALYPNVKVNVVADGTGNLLNRIKAESAAPEADILWGGMEAENVDKAFRRLSYREQTLLEQRNTICMTFGRVSDMSTWASSSKRWQRRLRTMRRSLVLNMIFHSLSRSQVQIPLLQILTILHSVILTVASCSVQEVMVL